MENQKEPKIYLGKGKKVEGMEIVNCSLDLTTALTKVSFTDKSGHAHVNFKVQQMKQPDQYGNTHTIVLDTYKKTTT